MNCHEQFLSEVYTCKRCPSEYDFTSATDMEPYFKFPPTIGALGHADLLFVGINPRISRNNLRLHKEIMADKTAFADLAENRDGHEPYIVKGGREKHYHHHVEIVESLYGDGAKFEDHAAVTELFFCATENAANLPINIYPCADLYFDRVFRKVKPRIVVCVWKTVFEYFRRRFHMNTNESFLITIEEHSSMVVFLPHPNSQWRR